jgi:hypothetical protein
MSAVPAPDGAVTEPAAGPATWLVDALELADGCTTVREAAAELRETFAPLRVVVVDAMDMRGETPAAASARHQIFLGASDGHCWRVTQDVREAAGLFLCPAA